MATIYLLEAVNLFMGDHDPNASNHLELEEFKLPEPSIKTSEHAPGGGVLTVDFGMNLIEKLEPTFKLRGFNPERLKQFGLNTPYRNIFTAYGVVRDKRTGRAIEAKAVIEAKLGKLTPDAFKRGDDFGHEYAMIEVVHYELFVGPDEIFAVDFFENTYRVGGADQFADANRILRVPGASG
jgi:P2 family phage contractile tail tube protein